MSRPIASERPHQPGSLSRAPLRARSMREMQKPSLMGARLWRALRRQALPFLATAAVVAGGGLLFETSGGASIESSAPLWAFVGVVSGFGVAALRELGRNTITSVASLGKHRGYAVLGAAPMLTPLALRQLPPDMRTPLGVMALQPASAFAASFRDLQDAIAADGMTAFIAASADEGASTAALCAAVAAAQQGRRVVVVDCDIRRRSLTRALGADPKVGVLEAAERPESWRSFVEEESETGLPFIPAAAESNPWRTLYGTPGFTALLEHLRREFELVVLDCAPATAADGVVVARLADRCVVVANWDETPLAALRRLVRALRAGSRLTTGVFVNRVPPGYRFGRVRPD